MKRKRALRIVEMLRAEAFGRYLALVDVEDKLSRDDDGSDPPEDPEPEPTAPTNRIKEPSCNGHP